MINLSIPPGAKAIELGGGDQPLVHPNLDFRQAHDAAGNPTVDIVCDLNDPFPITSEEWEVVYSRFAIEHISWRRIKQFISECFRILKPGGKMALITANTEAQMKYVLSLPEWGDEASRVLFGDQNYAGNFHACALSPQHLGNMLQEAGFTDILIFPYGAIKTDMAVEATRPHLPQLGEPKREIEMGEVPDDVTVQPATDEPQGVLVGVTSDFPDQAALIHQIEEYAEQFKLKIVHQTVPAQDVTPVPTLGHPLAAIDPQILAEIEEPVPEPDVQIGVAVSEDKVQMDWVKDAPEMVAKIEKHFDSNEASQQRAAQFNMAYFDAGGVYGGMGYWDFPAHELTKNHIMLRRPESVLEIGAARGYVLKRLQDAGVDAWGIDISKHCHMTRACDGIILADLCNTPWQLTYGAKATDKRFDLIFSIDTLDRIPEEFIPALAKEMARTCRRGLHGIDFDATPDGPDSSRVTIKPKSWWQRVLPPGHEVVHKNILEAGQIPEPYFRGDGKVKVQVGCYTQMFHHGWINCEQHDLAGFAQQCRYEYRRLDARNGLPWKTGEVDMIFHSHFFEHLDYREGVAFLRDCRRIIKPGGRMRVVVPDSRLLMSMYCGDQYMGDELAEFDEINRDCANQPTAAGKLQSVLWGNEHRALYDWETLEEMLRATGWEPRLAQFRVDAFESGLSQMLRETTDSVPCMSLFVDAVPKVVQG